MRTSPVGIALIQKFEGCKLEAYRCSAGVLTIGYGRTKGVKKGDTCTQAQADAWLVEDLDEAEDGVHICVEVKLTQNEFDALVSFTFNLGIKSLSQSTLLRLLNQGKTKEAAAQFHRWCNAGGKRVEGLVRRRAAEADLFLRVAQPIK
jgi:lysozyme